MILRPRQAQFVDACIDALGKCGNTLGIAPTGAGKTVMGSAILAPFVKKAPVLVIQHRDELVTQNKETFKRYNPSAKVDVFNAERKAWSLGATFAMVQTLCRPANLATMPSGMSALFIDECFPKGTLIDGKPIEEIGIGDNVKTHLGEGKVTHLFKSKPTSFVSIHFVGGQVLNCTGSHPVWTQRGFVAAKDLTSDDMMVNIIPYGKLRNLRKGNPSQNVSRSTSRQAVRTEGVQGGALKENHTQQFRETWRRDNKIQKDEWDARSSGARNCLNQTACNEVEATGSEGEWDWANNPSACDSICPRVANGGCHTDKTEIIGKALSNLLQSGCWEFRTESCSGGRRKFSFISKEKGSRRKERRVFEVYRVDGIEVHQQTSCGTFGGLCPDGFVYNIEVENGNTYFANGYLVHNCHHVAAESYMNIVQAFRERSPDGVILGLTATPERGDKQALTAVFNNVADKITVGELIAAGNLVQPRAFRMDIGLNDQLQNVQKTGAEFDMGEVEAIMDKRAVHSEILRHWREKASDRSTVVFCSTIQHAQHLAEAFREEGISAEAVHSEMSDDDNATVLRRFDQGKIKVLLNVMKLTEGWDCQRVGCVVLVRPCSQKSTMIQMIGRGLRPCIDAKRYPGVIKSDCIVLDFGASLLTHGDIDAGDRLFVRQSETGEAPMKKCPECGIQVPAAVGSCPVCGYVFPVRVNGVETIESFEMSEMQIIEMSPFRWESMYSDAVRMANALTAWGAVIRLGEVYNAIGGVTGGAVTIITRTNSKELALAQADDFLRSNGDRTNSRKTRSWIKLPPTDSQLKHMADVPMFGMSRYRASCVLTWKFNEARIKKAILG